MPAWAISIPRSRKVPGSRSCLKEAEEISVPVRIPAARKTSRVPAALNMKLRAPFFRASQQGLHTGCLAWFLKKHRFCKVALLFREYTGGLLNDSLENTALPVRV